MGPFCGFLDKDTRQLQQKIPVVTEGTTALNKNLRMAIMDFRELHDKEAKLIFLSWQRK